MDFELELISPFNGIEPSGDYSESTQELLKLVTTGKYKECIIHIKNTVSFLNLTSMEDIYQLKFLARQYLTDDDESLRKEIEILCYGVSCLQLFVINNWTGPESSDLTSLLFTNFDSVDIKERILQELDVDGENVYALIADPILLYIAMILFQQFDLFHHLQTAKWWCLRYISIHQQLIPERSPTLHELSKALIQNFSQQDFLESEQNRSYKIQFYLETGLLQLFYYQYKEAEQSFQTATALCGIECSLDGALGVRTRFQEKLIAQLRVQINRTRNDKLITKAPTLTDEDIPKALPLNDDTLLEAVKYSEEEVDENQNLIPEEQAVILMMCTKMQKTSASHKLKDEQIKCVIEYLLSDPKSWSIHTESLRVRCIHEKHKSRTVERSMMQLESLVKNISLKSKCSDDNHHLASLKRLSLFYSVWPKPKWIMEKQLAMLYESLGVRASSLEIYMRLHMWEEAIVCLISTERGHEAEELIRKQLAIKETANLYCLLGDILLDPDLYLKGWDISNQRSARSMRSLGAYKISKKLYKEAIECFEKSLAVNYLQTGTWFSMGCAALACEDFDKAAMAFQRCVSLNWDNFEAWTNLAVSFVRANKKDQAYKALVEALKCNYDRWELWENFLFVSADTGHFSDLIRAYNRLLDLKDKYVDIPVLKILVRAMNEDILGSNNVPASKLKQKALTLFGRLTSKTTSNWEVWSLYAKVLGNGTGGENKDENAKALTFLQKSLRSALQRPSWEKDSKSAEQAVTLCIEVIDACSVCHKQENMNEGEFKSMITSTRLSINGVKAKLRVQEEDLLNEESKLEFANLAQKVEDKLQILNELMSTSS
uniref:tetratricopeptide repeat protein 27-like n=1 Tax=Styela clava TaxID=7725 RepID=UPI00193A3671|nr:tetratricopeptide repeat protein 27-like [Styela clava]